MNEKIQKACPLTWAGGVDVDDSCVEHRCAWWVEGAYSTENVRQEGRCAIKLIAEKNSEGLVVV